MAVQEVSGSVEWIDNPGWSLRGDVVLIPFVAFFRYDRVVRVVLTNDGEASLLSGEIRRGDIIGSALFSGVRDSHRAGLVFVDGRGRIGGFAGGLKPCRKKICHRSRVRDLPTSVDSGREGCIHIGWGGR